MAVKAGTELGSIAGLNGNWKYGFGDIFE